MESAHVSSGPFLYVSIVPGSCAPSVLSDSHARYNGHSRSIVLSHRRPRCSLSVAPTYSPRVVLLLGIIAHAVLKIRANHAEPRSAWSVARDSNNKSLIQQLSWILCRLFPTFTDPSHNSLVPSGVRNRVLHKSRFGLRSSRSLEEVILSAAFRLFGSCKVMAINKIRLGGKGEGGVTSQHKWKDI